MSREKLRIEVFLSARSLNLASGSVLMWFRFAKHAAGSVLSDLAAKDRPGTGKSDFGNSIGALHSMRLEVFKSICENTQKTMSEKRPGKHREKEGLPTQKLAPVWTKNP